MQDVYFTYVLAAVWGGSLLAYLVSGASARSERVEGIGGTMLLGKGVMNWTYWMTEPVVRSMVALGVTANSLTWASLVLGVGAGVALATGWFGLACLLAVCSTIGDILDGQVARHSHTGSNRGELLDAAVDRYTELAFLGGMIIYFRDSVPLILLGLAALQACMMVSYATAKAEALGVTPPRGLMRRHERSTYLIVGAGLSPLIGEHLTNVWPQLPPTSPAIAGLVVVATIGNYAAVRRLVQIGQALR